MTFSVEPHLLACMEKHYDQLVNGPLVKYVKFPKQKARPRLPLKPLLRLDRVQPSTETDHTIERPDSTTDPATWASDLAGKADHGAFQASADFHIQTNQEALVQGPPGTGKTFVAHANAVVVNDSLEQDQKSFDCQGRIDEDKARGLFPIASGLRIVQMSFVSILCCIPQVGSKLSLQWSRRQAQHR